MTAGHLEFSTVSFCYASSGAMIFDNLSLRFHRGWSGVTGPNGSGKTTLLRLACGELKPLRGIIRASKEAVYCPQHTEQMPAGLQRLVESADPSAGRLRGVLGIAPDWPERWDTLSHGEQKRAQIAVALWRRPAVLAVDEPTNHLDTAARRMVRAALESFRGTGLLVSHDRDLLDALCVQCVMVEPPGAAVRPGGYTKARALAEADDERARKEAAEAKREVKGLRKTAAERARKAAQADRKRSKRGLDPQDHDAKSRIDLARLSGKDGKAGRLLDQLRGRLQQAEARLAGIEARKKARMGIIFPGEPAKSDFLFRLPAGSLALGPDRTLVFPTLSMGGRDRVALVGANGAGKSTLIRHIVSRVTFPAERLVYIPQEIGSERAREVIAAVRNLPRKRLGAVITRFARLGSAPERILETDLPSPGELRKIMLSLGISRRPHLVIMDEPTNHLDLPSIECLERALAECGCALLLVSHDFAFLRRLAQVVWEISPDAGGLAGRVVLRTAGPEALANRLSEPRTGD